MLIYPDIKKTTNIYVSQNYKTTNHKFSMGMLIVADFSLTSCTDNFFLTNYKVGI